MGGELRVRLSEDDADGARLVLRPAGRRVLLLPAVHGHVSDAVDEDELVIGR